MSQTLADDGQLIQAAQNGDMASLEILLDRHHDRIRAVCAKVVGRGADADDAAQMALISIVRNLDKYDGRAKFTTWTYRIATNAAIDELRRRQRRDADTIDDDDSPVQLFSGTDIADETIIGLDIQEALSQLPEDFRVPVILRDLCGLDYAEIAEQLDIAPGTVRSRIARGRGKLAELIGPISENGPENGNSVDSTDVQGVDHD